MHAVRSSVARFLHDPVPCPFFRASAAVLVAVEWKSGGTDAASFAGDARSASELRRDCTAIGFLVSENGRTVATPLLLALLAIEATDVLFALDSVPAVFAVSKEPFIVYSSNVFAILGMRAMYLVLASMLNDLRYLHYGLGAILAFAGAKMLASGFVHVPHWLSLLIIVAILVAAIVPSVITRNAKARAAG